MCTPNPGRAVRALGLPIDALGAALLVLAGLHFAVTSFRSDRGWSQDIPAFYMAALAGLAAATLLAWFRKRPLADAGAFLAIAAGTMVFAYFSGKVAVEPTAEDMGRPPVLADVYLAATAAFAAAMAWIVPVRPVEGYLTAAIVFASPATRVLLRWHPDGFDVAPVCLALAAAVHARALDPRPIVLTSTAKAALAFAAIVSLSAWLSDSGQASIPAAARTLAQACAFAAVADYARREGAGLRLLRILAVIGLLVSACEVLIFGEFAARVGLTRASATRLESFSIHPNLVAPAAAVAAVFGLGFALSPVGLVGRAMGALAFGLGVVSVLLHRSGGATAGLVAGATLLIATHACGRLGKRLRVARVLPGAVLVAIPILTFAGALAAPSFLVRLEGGGEAGRINVGTRLEFWRAARGAIAANPLFGLGPRNVEAHAEFIDAAIEANVDWSNHPHNLTVELGETLGLTGIVAYFVVIAFASRSLCAALGGGDPGARAVAASGAAALGVLLVDGFFDHGFAEFAVVSDLFWFSCLLIECAAPVNHVDAGKGPGRRAGPVLSCLATGALMLGGLVPLACTALEQSVKWIQYWTSQSQRLDTFQDAEGKLERLRVALWLAPERADLRLTLADSLLSAGRVKEAIAEFERAAAQASHTAETLLRAASFHVTLGSPPAPDHVDRALALYTHATGLGNPSERAQAHLGRARCLGLQGKDSEALDALATALSISPSLPISSHGFRRLPPRADSPYPDAVFRTGGATPLSVTEACAKRLDTLRPQLDTSFETTWGPMSRLTECLVHIGRSDLAIAELEFIESKAPTKRMNIPSMMAQARMAARQYERALEDVDRAIANGGWHPTMSSLKSRLLDHLGRVNDAIVESARFVEGKYDPVAYRSMARDGFRRLAYSQQVASRYRQSCESFLHAAFYDNHAFQRVHFYVDGATAALRGAAQDASSEAEFLRLVDECFVRACRESGRLEWSDFDHQKLMELGAQLARAAPGNGVKLFDRLLDLVQSQSSVGSFAMTLGFGMVCAERLRSQKALEDLATLDAKLNALQAAIFALGPRGLSRS